MKKKVKKTNRAKKSKQVGTGFWSDVGDWVSDTYIKPIDNLLKKQK